MPAYIITMRKGPVRDAQAMAEYQRRTRALSGGFKEDFQLRPLAIYGATEALEGTAPDGTVIMEFPTLEAARAWYDDPGYQEAIPFRQQAADYEIFIVEGLDR